jgi:4-hydroxybenzoate polyprenyltransferase
MTFALLVTVGVMARLGPAYYMGLVLILGFLVAQHIMVSPDDLSRLNMSFFTMNGLISLVIFVATTFSL